MAILTDRNFCSNGCEIDKTVIANKSVKKGSFNIMKIKLTYLLSKSLRFV